jgi:hypothetical protein
VLESALKIGTCSLKLRGSVFSALSSAYWALNSLDKVNAQSTYSTHVEYRAVSGVFQNIDHPPPLPLASVSSPPNTHRAVMGWAVNSSEDARHCSVLYSTLWVNGSIKQFQTLSTLPCLRRYEATFNKIYRFQYGIIQIHFRKNF